MKLNRTNLILGIVSILMFLIYFYTIMDKKNIKYIEKYEYNVELENVYKANKNAIFRNDGTGKFFIHPGVLKPTKGTFVFHDSVALKLLFSLKTGAIGGKIEFTVLVNGDTYDRFIIDAKAVKSKSLNIFLNKGDKLTVEADKYGDLSYDWGSLTISKINIIDIFKQYIPAILWIVLFILLSRYGYGYSVIITYILFILSVYAESVNFKIYSYEIIMTYLVFYFTLTFIFVFLYSYLNRFYTAVILSSLISIILFTLFISLVLYASIFDTHVTKDILYAIFQTNPRESFEFLKSFIDVKYSFYLIFVYALLIVFFIMQSKRKMLKVASLVGVLIFLSFLSITFSQTKELRVFSLIEDSYISYKKELQAFVEEKHKRKTSNKNFDAVKDHGGETYIVIIGESLNKNHMGLYGYFRKTTPNLTEMYHSQDILKFNSVYSNHTVTTYTLSFALTQANQYNGLKYYNSISIVELLNKAKFETYWLTGQPTHGAFQNLVSVIAQEADHFIPLDMNDITKGFDGVLIQKVKNILHTQSKKNRVIFVHLMGSHYTYTHRYPEKEFSKYTGNLQKSDFGIPVDKNKKINYYDNSVLYNDYVVSSILKELEQYQGIHGMIYISDHSEDVVNNYAHNPTKFTYEMTEIPMIAWFSNEYKNAYNDKYKQFKMNVDTLFSNDMFYDTLTGIMGIKTSMYQTKYDLSSTSYELKEQDALVLHGAKKYIEKTNYRYWQRKNIKYLVEHNLTTRILPDGLNSFAMLKEAISDGLNSYGISIVYNKSRDKFNVGYNHKHLGANFEEYLKRIDVLSTKKIWFDLKNINRSNFRNILDRLQFLDAKFNIKSKVILKINILDDIAGIFIKNGWQISYELPRKTIQNYITNNKEKKMELLAMQIMTRAQKENITAFYFDKTIYSFVQKYLEKIASNYDINVVYHVKGGDIPLLWSTDFIDKLEKSEIFKNKNIHTIFISYKSKFVL